LYAARQTRGTKAGGGTNVIKVLLSLLLVMPFAAGASAQAANQKTGLLDAAQVKSIFPASVYFSGQTATVQMRNAGGVRWSEGRQTLFGMVDTGGYSSGMRDKYQFYILSDVPVEIGGKRLPAGAYGAGFLNGPGSGSSLEVMDLGGAELFHAAVQHDAAMQRPRPLEVVAGANGHYRLYLGRDFVEFAAAR
jgi:hypothetical protein